ncbi:MAG: Gfo/Idh/MocA family oxidoreductase [Fimbriimonas sp.]|nr:Gfo/Idh/MocA family oxidoreductase [Fimbriimonas sp.]
MAGNTNGTIRAAVLGYGGAFSMGKYHGEMMNKAGMQTVAACDLDPARMVTAELDFPGIRTYTDPEKLYADPDVDLIVVILPHNLHAPAAIKAAQNGKHVVVEKPMCISVAEADAMIEAAKANNVMLSIFHNRRWDGDFMTIRELIETGMIGNVFHIEAAMGHMGRPGDWWRSDKKISGGALFDWGAHIIDWTLHYLPKPVIGVDGFYQKLRWFDHSNEDHTELIMRFEGGARASVEISSLAAAGKARWRILGTKGAIVMNSWDKIEVSVDHDGYIAKFEAPVKKTNQQAYYDNIAGHLTRGEDLVVTAEGGRRIIAMIEAAEQSSIAGHTVKPAYA